MPFGDNTDIPTKMYLLEILNVSDSLGKTVLLIGVASGLSTNNI